MVNKGKLFSQFPPVSTEEWMDKLTADLKGEDFSKKLIWKTNEGFSVKPFYRREDLENLPHMKTFLPLFIKGDVPAIIRNRGIRKINNHWLIRQNITVSDYSASNRSALDILTRGIDSVGFIIADPESLSKENLKILLKDINLRSVEINFLCNGRSGEIFEYVAEIADNKGVGLDSVSGTIETDPIGRLMINGKLCVSPEAGFDYLASLVNESRILPGLRVIQVNGPVFNNAGATSVQELAFSMSMASEYMTQLTDRGIGSDLAVSKIRFSFGTGSNYFMEIAKLRAARLLWPIIVDGFGYKRKNQLRTEIHCETSSWNKTIYNPYVNMLRTQTEAMSAVLGGANSLTVKPFDFVFSQPDEFSERIARNQQIILREESYFDKVADPSAGSYYIENLTYLIADHSWKLFLEIEERGGFISSLKSGYVQEKLKHAADKRKDDVARCKEKLLGINHFPEPGETVSALIDAERIFIENTTEEDLLVEPVTICRGAEEFEKIRLAVDRAKVRPVVFLLAVGDPVMRKARSQFASDFFGCAGYNVVDYQGFHDVEHGVTTALESQADIIVICSSDEEYSTLTPGIFNRLKNRTLVVVTGNPSCMDEMKAKGLDLIISIGSDTTETLKSFNDMLGITI
jgi:methylmalonyl-CoA mutase